MTLQNESLFISLEAELDLPRGEKTRSFLTILTTLLCPKVDPGQKFFFDPETCSLSGFSAR